MFEVRNILVIGVGSIGERHLRCLQATGRAHVSICEINEKRRARVVREYGVTEAYADLDSAMAGTYDAAVIATPAHLHVAMAIRLAEAGVHLLIEKPLSTSFDGIEMLEATLSRNNLRAAVAYVLRHEPAMKAMRDAIRDCEE